IRTAVVRDQVVRTTLTRQLENLEDDYVQLSARKKGIRIFNSMSPNESPSTIRDSKIMLETFDENFASDLKEKAQLSTTPFLPKKLIDASNTFGKVEFPSYYKKLKSIWNNQDATNYHIIDLGGKDTSHKVHDLLDEDELKLLFNRLVLDDEDMHINEKT
ncbi:8637_t:CDS:2, partial [Acaulospora morrowiae]